MALSVMVIITLLISLWWPLMIWFSHPDFSAMVAQQESSAWINRSTHPFYHYWSFPVQSGVWTILAVIALWFPYAKKRIDHFGNYSFLAFWTISSVILLSLFPEKKERYLLPVLIPLAMMVACYTRYLIEAFNEKFTTKSDLIIFQVNTIIMLMVSSMIPVALFVYLKETGKPAFGTLILSAFLFWGLTCLFVISLLRKKILLLWYAMCGIVLALCLVLMPWAPEISVTNPNFHPYQELRHREDLKNANFYFNGEIPGKFIEVIWNSGHEIKSWDPWKNPQLPGRLPILFLSYQDPTTVLPADILSHYQIEVIGHFDSNPTKKGGNIVLANYATLIR